LPSAFELAYALKDKNMLLILMESVHKLKQHHLETHREALFAALEELPDFSVDLHFECSSPYIPFLSHLAPYDTYHIYKSGSNLRLDSTLLGFKKLKSIRGNISVLLKGRSSGDQEGELLMIDHDRKTVASVFEENAGSAKIQRDIDNIMNGE